MKRVMPRLDEKDRYKTYGVEQKQCRYIFHTWQHFEYEQRHAERLDTQHVLWQIEKFQYQFWLERGRYAWASIYRDKYEHVRLSLWCVEEHIEKTCYER